LKKKETAKPKKLKNKKRLKNLKNNNGSLPFSQFKHELF